MLRKYFCYVILITGVFYQLYQFKYEYDEQYKYENQEWFEIML